MYMQSCTKKITYILKGHQIPWKLFQIEKIALNQVCQEPFFILGRSFPKVLRLLISPPVLHFLLFSYILNLSSFCPEDLYQSLLRSAPQFFAFDKVFIKALAFKL